EDAVTVWRETRLGGDAFEPVVSRLVLRWGDVFNSAPGYWQTKLRKAFADPPFTPWTCPHSPAGAARGRSVVYGFPGRPAADRLSGSLRSLRLAREATV